MTLLQPFLAYPLHPASWQRPKGSRDYRVTNGFTGVDMVNGGQHNAVDVGNYRQGDPITAPIGCRARGRVHSDGAIGVSFDLGGGWVLEFWHLDTLELHGAAWQQVTTGQPVGTTGDTGAPVNGKPMPAHTHIALLLNGKPRDPEPHLPMPERDAKPIPGATAGYTFSDVPPTHRFYSDIEWLVREGITSPEGVNGSGRYVPEGYVTRGQMAAFLRRASR